MSHKKVKESYISSDKNNFRLNKKANQSKIRNAKKNKEFLQESDNLVGELPSGAFDLNTSSEKKIIVEDKKESIQDIDNKEKETVIDNEEYEEEQFDENYFEPVEYKG